MSGQLLTDSLPTHANIDVRMEEGYDHRCQPYHTIPPYYAVVKGTLVCAQPMPLRFSILHHTASTPCAAFDSPAATAVCFYTLFCRCMRVCAHACVFSRAPLPPPWVILCDRVYPCGTLVLVWVGGSVSLRVHLCGILVSVYVGGSVLISSTSPIPHSASWHPSWLLESATAGLRS